MTMTRTGKCATKEQHAAAEYLGSLDDSLARWMQSTGPIDAYDAHLPVTVGRPLEWFSFAVTSRQLSRASSLAIYHRLVARFGGVITAERVVSTDEQTLRDVGLSRPVTLPCAERSPDSINWMDAPHPRQGHALRRPTRCLSEALASADNSPSEGSSRPTIRSRSEPGARRKRHSR